MADKVHEGRVRVIDATLARVVDASLDPAQRMPAVEENRAAMGGFRRSWCEPGSFRPEDYADLVEPLPAGTLSELRRHFDVLSKAGADPCELALSLHPFLPSDAPADAPAPAGPCTSQQLYRLSDAITDWAELVGLRAVRADATDDA